MPRRSRFSCHVWCQSPKCSRDPGLVIGRRAHAKRPHSVDEDISSRTNLTPQQPPILWMYRYLSVRFTDVGSHSGCPLTSRSLCSHSSLQVCCDRRPFLVPDPSSCDHLQAVGAINKTRAVFWPHRFSFRFAPRDEMTSEGYRLFALSSGNTMI